MKNLHLLPTDKPSRLYNNNGKLHLDSVLTTSNGHTINQNIYITSTELTLAKKGDWYLGSPCYTELIRCHRDSFPNEKPKVLLNKIILTTDTDLIADGIQAIDDEFLEWFMKNPSCEFVETDESKYFDGSHGEYLIIIPQEVTKQQEQ